MTVNDPANKVRIVADGIGTVYNFTFRTTLSTTDMFVYRVVRATSVATLQVEGVDYSIALNDNKLGGAVTSLTVWPATDDVLIFREIELTQGTVYPDTGSMTKAQIEDAVDRVTMICQQIDEALDRTLRIDIGDDSSPSVVPTLVAGGVLTTDGAVLQWNTALIVDAGAVPGALNPGDDDKVLLANTGAWSWQSFTISLITDAVADLKTFLASATLAAARTNLGLGTVATLDTGVTAGDVPVLDAGAQLPVEIRVPRGYIDGLRVSDAAEVDHDRTFAVGAARDSTNTTTLVLDTAMTKQIDATWAVGTNAGGLFSGAVTTGWYYLFIIEKTSDGTIDAGFDTSLTAANIPSGYSKYRVVGARKTDGSANLYPGRSATGGWFFYTTPVLDISRTNPGVALDATDVLSAPPLSVAELTLILSDETPDGSARGLINSTFDTSTPPTNLNHNISVSSTSGLPSYSNTILLQVDASSTVRTRFVVTTSDTGIDLVGRTNGYIDVRGKDD